MNIPLLTYIVKITMLIVVITFSIDNFIYHSFNVISDKVLSGSDIGKLNHYLKIRNDLDLIIYGNSRAKNHVDPQKLADKSFNIGVAARKIAYSATLIKVLPLKKEQTVLLHIDIETAFDVHYDGADIKALTSKYNRNKIIHDEIIYLSQNNKLQNIFKSLSYNGSILRILKNYLSPRYNYKNYHGYDPIKVNEDQRKRFQLILNREAVENKCQKNFTLNPIYEHYLDEIQEFCNQNNKSLILFTSPMFEDFCKEDNLRFSEILEERNLNYYDMTDLFKENNKIEYWKDRIHLSTKGAKLFTAEMKKLLSS
ncbi:MAG: hypothetical protein Mars2KO_10030 [Maribacter sp.]